MLPLLVSIVSAACTLQCSLKPRVHRQYSSRTLHPTLAPQNTGNFTVIHNKPTIMVEDLPNLRDNYCSRSLFDLTFNSVEMAAKAAMEWRNYTDLAIIADTRKESDPFQNDPFNDDPFDHGPCENTMSVAFLVKNIVLDKEHIRLDVEPYSLSKLVNMWSFEVGPTSGHQIVVPLDANYANGQAKQPLNFVNGAVSCSNCYTHGQAQLVASIKGTGFSVNEFKLGVNGNLFGNVDVGLNLDALRVNGQNQRMTNSEIFNLTLPSFVIPGVFSFEPKFHIYLSTVISSSGNGQVTAGFDVNWPIDWIWHMQKQEQAKQPAIFRAHPITQTGTQSFEVGVQLKPELGVDINLFSVTHMSLKSNYIAQVDAAVRLQKCKRAPFSLHLSQQQSIGIEYAQGSSIRNFPLWSNKGALTCPFCDQC